jgi:hypothetical protein
LIGLVFLSLTADAQAAQTLYCATAADGPGNLYTVDPTTAASTLVGPVDIGGTTNVAITGLAFHPMTGVLYGVTSNISSNARSLVTINSANGNATLIGSLGSFPVGDITFDAAGTLYGWMKAGGGGLRATLGRTGLVSPTDGLVTINLSTGAATPVGPSGITNSQGSGLAFALGTLYLSTQNADGPLRTVNPATGLTSAGPTMDGTGSRISAMAASPTGVLFGVVGGSLATINTGTGAISSIGSLPGGTDALAFLGSAVGPAGAGGAEIPALGTLGLLVLGALLAGAGFLVSRGR